MRAHAPPGATLSASDVMRVARAFSASECDAAIELMAGRARYQDEFTGFGEVRGASEVVWLPTKDAPRWLYQRLAGLLAEAARDFAFDVSRPIEDLKLIRYRPGNRVAWHVDCGGGAAATRKLTLTVLLSRPDDFDGGDLTVAGYPGELHRARGDVVIFPSVLAHKVTTVKRGNRHTLIAWAHGKPFT